MAEERHCLMWELAYHVPGTLQYRCAHIRSAVVKVRPFIAEETSHRPKVTQLVSDKVGIWTLPLCLA